MLIKEPENTTNFISKYFFINARTAFKTILSKLNFGNGKKILLPAYIGITEREGSGVFDPVQEKNIPYDFYAIDYKLGAVKKELLSKIESGNYGALLIIHYFGFCQNDMVEIVSYCKKHNVILIEDCAHALHSFYKDKRLGTFGDFGIYSLHKIFPTEVGGMLEINNTDYLDLIEKPNSSTLFQEAINQYAQSDIIKIKNKKRENYSRLLDLISKIEQIELMYPNIADGISPHNFPILVKNNQREPLYFKLIEKKIPVIALYYRMIEPIKNANFDVSNAISKDILNLPIHQDIEVEDITFIAKELANAIHI